jgi:cytochrome c peroxidase
LAASAILMAVMLAIAVAPATAQKGGTIKNGSTNFLSTELFFEPEVPFVSLKKSPPTWNEIEQLMDNPYQVVSGTACNDIRGAVPGNDQGYPTYCTPSIFIRRPAFGVTLPPMFVHPLNHNPATGAEMRLLNQNYSGGAFNATGVCYAATTDPNATCVPTPLSITVSSGARVTETEIDYVVAIGRKAPFCQANPEPVPLALPMTPSSTRQDVNACGADPGEPGAVPHLNALLPDSHGFPALGASFTCGGQFISQCVQNTGQTGNDCRTYCEAASAVPANDWYSTPAVPGVLLPQSIIPSTARLYDPAGRGFIDPLDVATGVGGLRKPSLRVADAGGTGTNPNYLNNTDPNNVAPSNENDFIGLFGTGTLAQQKQNARLEAMVLGKSLFWDMQVGSDAVQSCGSCHFHAGADNRTRNQINPNDKGGDLGFTIPVNTDVTAATFPLHKLNDPEVAGDPRCTPPIIANVAGIQFPDGTPAVHPLTTVRVCDAGNIQSSTNDVLSSMGVHFGRFFDIPAIGSFGPASAIGGVKSVLPDLRSPIAADNMDPIPGFAGANGNQFRRVEPRNTPTIFLADVNFDNFWDGRARHDFNGGSMSGSADPQSHVFVDQGSGLTPTRQMIKFSSLASLATGPALSEFEMSFVGRNWAKIAKKLLQSGVTPLANQLVDPTDGILGRYSNQNGSACASLPAADRSPAGSTPTTLGAGVPGLCISYPALIRHAFYPALWRNTTQHLNGCYTDRRPDIHPNQCSGLGPIPILNAAGTAVDNGNTVDPFDVYRLTVASGPANPTDTNQFTQMEGNTSLFFGLSIHLWATILVPDDTPWDKFLDANPDAYYSIGESGEPLLVLDLPNCNSVPNKYTRDSIHGACFAEIGNFKRDPGLTACINETVIAGVRQCTETVPAGGTRTASAPDPLLGMDIFFGSNVSLKNPQFRSARCGECHAPPTLTDHTVPFTTKAVLNDIFPEFEKGRPIFEPLVEPLGRARIISGFLLESEINEPGQDAIERRVINQSIAPAPISPNVNCTVDTCSGYPFPDGITTNFPGPGYTIRSDIGTITQGPLVGNNTPVPFTSFGSAFFDNGMYNIGVRPCVADQAQVIGPCEDAGRGDNDAFGWPFSLAALMLKDLGGPGQQPGVPMLTFDPSAEPACAPFCATGGLFATTAHDQRINPGFDDEPIIPMLPPYLSPFANKITVGDAHPSLDEACGPIAACINTLTDAANAEGFPEIPFDPRPDVSEVTNGAVAPGNGVLGGPGEAQMGTWPMVNRVGRFGSFKAPQLREVELTGPYFHNGGKLTLRQVVDFYVRGGDFPVTNSQHRDFNIINLNADLQSNLDEAEKVALVDFMLELTDDRVKFDRAPFDHPQMIVPLDGTAPENGSFAGRALRDAALASCVPSPLGPGKQACMGGMFLNVPATGAAGASLPVPNFLGITSGPRLVGPAANCGPAANNHYCH